MARLENRCRVNRRLYYMYGKRHEKQMYRRERTKQLQDSAFEFDYPVTNQ